MERRRIIQFKVTQTQYERIILRKENAGYPSVAQFLRDFLFKDDLATDKMIREIHKEIVGKKKDNAESEDKNEENKIGI